ncbi:hypothetical protein P171DRAFT_440770 [Karstenula rhodostoma CBS 690.94]|uniref:Uncharacterized protein n=1 Tax=Karstenula rhodostoma CBS 690.94 TaxID=1392251 RepID=A0A9P4UFT5_9PLEO|nr:hypothetical protein P171DRAFT_440770 [Karstenula rhodostoma CBS 690.94]
MRVPTTSTTTEPYGSLVITQRLPQPTLSRTNQPRSAPPSSSIAATTPSASGTPPHTQPPAQTLYSPITGKPGKPTKPSRNPSPRVPKRPTRSSTRKGLFYYDFSFVDCAKDIAYRQGNAERCPGWDAGLQIQGTSGCKEMICGKGERCIHNGQGAYYIDESVQKWGLGEPVGTCPNYKEGIEIGFVLCSSAPPLTKELD